MKNLLQQNSFLSFSQHCHQQHYLQQKVDKLPPSQAAIAKEVRSMLTKSTIWMIILGNVNKLLNFMCV